MTYNAIKGRFTRVAPDKTILYGEKSYTFTLTPEQSEQIDQAVYAVDLGEITRINRTLQTAEKPFVVIAS